VLKFPETRPIKIIQCHRKGFTISQENIKVAEEKTYERRDAKRGHGSKTS
jgi:hypothetical protein